MKFDELDPSVKVWFEVSRSAWPQLTEQQFVLALIEVGQKLGSVVIVGEGGSDKVRDGLINALTKRLGPPNLTLH